MKATNQLDRFQVSVEYLTEYSGVKGAVIADREGLVIATSPREGFDSELCAAIGLDLVKIIDRNLIRLKSDCVVLHRQLDGNNLTPMLRALIQKQCICAQPNPCTANKSQQGVDQTKRTS